MCGAAALLIPEQHDCIYTCATETSIKLMPSRNCLWPYWPSSTRPAPPPPYAKNGSGSSIAGAEALFCGDHLVELLCGARPNKLYIGTSKTPAERIWFLKLGVVALYYLAPLSVPHRRWGGSLFTRNVGCTTLTSHFLSHRYNKNRL